MRCESHLKIAISKETALAKHVSSSYMKICGFIRERTAVYGLFVEKFEYLNSIKLVDCNSESSRDLLQSGTDLYQIAIGTDLLQLEAGLTRLAVMQTVIYSFN